MPQPIIQDFNELRIFLLSLSVFCPRIFNQRSLSFFQIFSALPISQSIVLESSVDVEQANTHKRRTGYKLETE